MGQPMLKEVSRQSQPRRNLIARRRALTQKAGGQRQELVHPFSRCGARNCAARFRADKGQILAAAGQGTAPKVKAVAHFLQQPQFPAHIVDAPAIAHADTIKKILRPVIKRTMRLTLGQEEGQKRADGIQARERQPISHQPRPRPERLGGVGAKMLIQPRVPAYIKLRPRLQDRRQFAGRAAMDDPGMAAMGKGENLDDRGN